MCDRLNCSYIPPKNTIVVKDDKMYLSKDKLIELPPLPRKIKFLNPLVIGDTVYTNGYELINGKWKRTLKAILYNSMRF